MRTRTRDANGITRAQAVASTREAANSLGSTVTLGRLYHSSTCWTWCRFERSVTEPFDTGRLRFVPEVQVEPNGASGKT